MCNLDNGGLIGYAFMQKDKMKGSSLINRILKLNFFMIKIAVILIAVASMMTFAWVSVRMGYHFYKMWHGAIHADFAHVMVNMVAVIDGYLLAVLLLMVACSLDELFFGTIDWLPEWLKVKDLKDLKHNLSSVLIIMLAVIFMEHLFAWRKPEATLMFAASVALVMIALVLYLRVKIIEDQRRETKP